MDDVIRKVSIAAYLREYHDVDLDEGRMQHKITCISPDHDDSTPSATVSLEHEYYHCWSCGLRGDAYDLVQAIDRIELPEAIEMLKELPADDGTGGTNHHRGARKPRGGRTGKQKPKEPFRFRIVGR